MADNINAALPENNEPREDITLQKVYKNFDNAVEKKLDDIKEKIEDLDKLESEVKVQGKNVKEEIHLMAERMINAIRQSEKNLTEEVDSVTDSKLQIVMSQKKSAERSCGRLKGYREYMNEIQETEETNAHQQVLRSIMEHAGRIMEEINVEHYIPIEKCDVQFIKNEKIELHCIGDIVSSTSALHQCKVKKINSHQVISENDTFSFPLSIESPSSSLVTVPLSSLSCSVTSTIPVDTATAVTTTDHPGVYKIHCTPVIRGSHQVNIRVNGIQLESASVVVPFNPYLDTITEVHTISELDGPFGIAITNDNIVVAERDADCVSVLDKKGKKTKTFSSSGDIKFSHPRGIAITPDDFILVTDNHKIQKISMDGKLIASVGQRGTKPLEFNSPNDVEVSPITGKVYVVDYKNHRIQVLNPDLTFSFSFGGYGSEEGQFYRPSFVTFDNQGTVYVSDCDNHRIQKFTSDGKFLSKFGTRGSGPGQFQFSQGLVISGDFLYAADFLNHRVCIFTTDGSFIRSFDVLATENNQCFGMALDDEGYLYVCDGSNNRLVVY